jgi:hypothetical protein
VYTKKFVRRFAICQFAAEIPCCCKIIPCSSKYFAPWVFLIGLNVPVSMKCKTDKPGRHKDGSGHHHPMGVFPIEKQVEHFAPLSLFSLRVRPRLYKPALIQVALSAGYGMHGPF